MGNESNLFLLGILLFATFLIVICTFNFSFAKVKNIQFEISECSVQRNSTYEKSGPCPTGPNISNNQENNIAEPQAKVDSISETDKAEPQAKVDSIQETDKAEPQAKVDSISETDKAEPQAKVDSIPETDKAEPQAKVDDSLDNGIGSVETKDPDYTNNVKY